MKWQKLKGQFIVLDGPDGAGKSTQVRLLGEHLEREGIEVLLLRDPGGTEIGNKIRQILLDKSHEDMSVLCEMLLFMASRAQLYYEKIAPALNGCVCVLCDRWISSTIAYQAVAGKVGTEQVLNIAREALERTWPDLTIIIDLPADKGLKRAGANPDRMEMKSLEYHNRVREAFLELVDQYNDMIYRVDGAESIEQVQQQILEVIKTHVGN